jgi:hypothetical protein
VATFASEFDVLGVFVTRSPKRVALTREIIGYFRSGNQGKICLRADFPFPPRNQGLPYFEISILQPDDSESEPSIVAVGLTGEFTNQIYAHPGWNAWSLGYHGDDGDIYEEVSRGGHSTGGRTYGPENTVGCGIDFENGQYLFTLDGKVVCTSDDPDP